MHHNILIKSYTRTGSTFIRNFFYNNGDSYNVDLDKNKLPLPDKNNILHCHNYKTKIGKPKKWHFILSTRLDKFDQICSMFIAEHTQQWKHYSHYNFQLDLKLDKILERYKSLLDHETHWKIIGNKNFLSFHQINYENLFDTDNLIKIANNINFVFKKNIEQHETEISPFIKKDVINNYDLLKKQFIDITNDVGTIV